MKVSLPEEALRRTAEAAIRKITPEKESLFTLMMQRTL